MSCFKPRHVTSGPELMQKIYLMNANEAGLLSCKIGCKIELGDQVLRPLAGHKAVRICSDFKSAPVTTARC